LEKQQPLRRRPPRHDPARRSIRGHRRISLLVICNRLTQRSKPLWTFWGGGATRGLPTCRPPHPLRLRRRRTPLATAYAAFPTPTLPRKRGRERSRASLDIRYLRNAEPGYFAWGCFRYLASILGTSETLNQATLHGVVFGILVGSSRPAPPLPRWRDLAALGLWLRDATGADWPFLQALSWPGPKWIVDDRLDRCLGNKRL